MVEASHSNAISHKPCRSAWCFSERDQVREQLIRTVGAGRKLAPQSETDVHPAAPAVGRLDEGAGFLTLVVGEVLLELNDVVVVRVAFAEKVQAPFLHPVLTGRLVDLVWRGHQEVAGCNDLHG